MEKTSGFHRHRHCPLHVCSHKCKHRCTHVTTMEKETQVDLGTLSGEPLVLPSASRCSLACLWRECRAKAVGIRKLLQDAPAHEKGLLCIRSYSILHAELTLISLSDLGAAEYSGGLLSSHPEEKKSGSQGKRPIH